MDQGGNGALTPEQIAALDAWYADCIANIVLFMDIMSWLGQWPILYTKAG